MPSYSFPLFMATLGGLGSARFAPGTVATLVAGVPSVYVLNLVTPPWSVLLLIFVTVLSCCFSGAAETELGKTDPPEVVIDEWVGFMVTMAGFPLTLQSLLLGVLSFRLLDILKPWPVRIFQERLSGGTAIVMDDVAAGVLARLAVWVGLKLWI